ncbi:hypothetical protein HF086_015746 [Spodoptera exigua]|uniref:Uncharacterized protein n=1 Tax=Spodoptera exigua TaxID=7107 RepID=A0A922MMA5_SPOEX|nr:hypothetical protein HF086_015746 [Spodoptera exigua]
MLLKFVMSLCSCCSDRVGIREGIATAAPGQRSINVQVRCVRQSCLDFDSASYLKKVRAAGGTTVAAVDAPDSPEPE